MKNFVKSKAKAIVRKFILRYLIVDRGAKKHKYIWETRDFKETMYKHLPKLLFLFCSTYACTKIYENLWKMKRDEFAPYSSLSARQSEVIKDNKVLR